MGAAIGTDARPKGSSSRNEAGLVLCALSLSLSLFLRSLSLYGLELKLLELFSGTGSVGRAFAEKGWEVISLDSDPQQHTRTF